MPTGLANPVRNLPERFNLAAAWRLVLPREHGSWSLALEPLALGLLVAPSRAAVPLVLAAVAGFFMRRPAKLLLQAKPDSRRSLAAGCMSGLLVIAGLGLLLTVEMAGFGKLWPLVPAAVAGFAFLWFDTRGENREEIAELAGVTAFALLPATFASLAGWRVASALALAFVMLARSAPTVLTVRTFLRRRKGPTVSVVPARLAAVMATGILAWLAMLTVVPWAVVVFSMLLAGRTIWLNSGQSVPLTARQLGFVELFLGVGAVVVAAITW